MPGARPPTSASTSSPVPPGSDTNAPCGDGFVVQRAKRAQHAAGLALGIEQPRKQRADRQTFDVAGVDAGEQRLGQVVDRFLAEAAAHERADRFVLVATCAGARTARTPCRSLPPS